MDLKKLLTAILFLLLFLPAYSQRMAIMGAMDQEISILVEALDKPKVTAIGGIDFYTGQLKEKKVVILKAGIGKVNAAYSTAVLTQNFNLEGLIFTGVAGGLHPEALPGDIVIGTAMVQVDFGLLDSEGFTPWNFKDLSGEPYSELLLNADSSLIQLSLQASKLAEYQLISNRKPRIFQGIISTSDLFVSDPVKADWLYSEFNSLATEMEGAAVAHVCRLLGLPFVVIRSCSDNANTDAHINFNEFVGPAAANSANLVLRMVELMPH
ncbi:5'-methylthioadenosine/adenosylhomocysteine nucleosidase [Cyclobacterium roseum]|uniref:5'-methylthioadenosine/adenosylhomocysteine nucleosidase n=1 Tax=Cyclobacterium roseum TaxID=2666137 RepID=UPI00139156CF|nr:5'-methylthioadenosine/adenosylhomocysteine nucleosidase [Cyclobacterium roseum]